MTPENKGETTVKTLKTMILSAGATMHWGLRNMQERAHQIGAQWNITTAARRWTEIEAIVPLAADK
jgi:signal transduction histidine kinase